jgi:Penicillin-insensitive murein endopeptidase
MNVRLPVLLTAGILLLAAGAAAASLPAEPKRERGLAPLRVPDLGGIGARVEKPPPRYERVRWRRSTPEGTYTAGRLVGGVRLPAEGRHFFTWDPVERHSPDRWWRRYGTDRLVRTVLGVAREYGAAHPGAARLGVGDLSRPRGGDFGIRFGPIGHASHQNGLDVDVYYPRADGRERAPRFASEIERGLSQELVDRFLARGAQVIFVGPNTGLTGPPGRVQVLVNHDNHLHVRLP